MELSPAHARKPRGFTLLEMLVSVTVLVIFLLMVLNITDLFNRTYTRTTSAMQTYDDVRAIVSLIGRDLSSSMVRTNAGRRLNFAVTASGNRTSIYFAVPDPKLQSLTNMSFVSHLAYFWDQDRAAVFRAVQNSYLDNSALLNTAASANNDSYSANSGRLGDITLSYGSGSPYAWHSDTAMTTAITQALDLPVLRNVFSFEALCYTNLPSQGGSPVSTWSDPDSLPRYLRLKVGVADEKNAAVVRRDPSRTDLLRQFEITVPMVGYGVYGNDYGPRK